MTIRLQNAEAEEYRRSHCDRKEVTHECVGKVTLAPGVLLLDCSLCGQANELLAEDMDIVNTARSIAKIFWQPWEDLDPKIKRQLLLELCALQRKAKQ